MKCLLSILVVLASVCILAITDQYFFCNVYAFEKNKPFSGDSIYNPYASAQPQNWVRCNFHAHVNCWDGITNGRGTAASAFGIYNSLHYGVHAISNYQSIDTTNSALPGYISSYEHGYNMKKNHQLVLGAGKVCWKDYLLPQTINNKQDILNRLSADSNTLVIINHPMVRNGYSFRDFKHLTNYTCLDVLSPSCISTSFWDAALSAGKPVFLTGNDDTHNIYDSNRVGSMCTWINTPVISNKNTLHALKTGDNFGMIVGKQTLLNEHRGKSVGLPFLKSLVMNGSTMTLKLSRPAKEIIITGKNGRVLHTAVASDSVVYTLAKQEPYAREVAVYNDGTQLFLNPVFRYQQHALAQMPVSINIAKTIFFRITGVLILLLWFGLLFMLFQHKKKQRKEQLLYQMNLKYGFSYYLADRAENIEIWHRRFMKHVNKFFNNLSLQRENKAE